MNRLPQQRAPRQPMLPGMSHLGRQFDAAQAARAAQLNQPESTEEWEARGRKQWSGPIPGQTVIGVAEPYVAHRPDGGGPWAVDEHGNVQEEFGEVNDYLRPYYQTHGGAHSSEAIVKAHWARQPLRQIRADTPVHTAQGTFETTGTDDSEKVNEIRASLESGGTLRKPAWLIQSRNRLYSLDGHHRMLAARQAGQETYPARVWNLEDAKHPPVHDQWEARDNWEERLHRLQRAEQRRYRTKYGGIDYDKYNADQRAASS